MAHTTRNRQELLRRVRRIRGQIEAIERTLGGDHECAELLQQVAACRGALNGLMAELIDGHIQFHVLNPGNGKHASRSKAAEELMDVVRAYLK
jgi:DNA-binding FrmR family transcriptional regulator